MFLFPHFKFSGSTLHPHVLCTLTSACIKMDFLDQCQYLSSNTPTPPLELRLGKGRVRCAVAYTLTLVRLSLPTKWWLNARIRGVKASIISSSCSDVSMASIKNSTNESFTWSDDHRKKNCFKHNSNREKV